MDVTAQIYESLAPLNGRVDHTTLGFIRRALIALDKWWQECDDMHRETPSFHIHIKVQFKANT